jgi:predicted HicB family RNase H-like nuclease
LTFLKIFDIIFIEKLERRFKMDNRFEELMSTLNSFYYDIEDVKEMPVRPYYGAFPVYEDGYIFDENKSVKWNREKVIIENKKYENECKRLREEKEKSFSKLMNRIAERLYDEIANVWEYEYKDGSEIKIELPEIKLAVVYSFNPDFTIDEIIEHIISYLNFLADHHRMYKVYERSPF